MGLGKTIRYVHETAKEAGGKKYLLFLFLSLMGVFQTYIHLVSTEEVIDSVTLLFEGGTTFSATVQTILFYGMLTIISVLLSLGKDKVTLRLHYDLSRYLKGQLNNKLSGMKMEYFETHESMVKIHDVKTRMEEVFQSYVKSIADYVSAMPLLVVYGFYLSRINPYYVLAYGVLFVVFNMLLSRGFRGIHSIWGRCRSTTRSSSIILICAATRIPIRNIRQTGCKIIFPGYGRKPLTAHTGSGCRFSAGLRFGCSFQGWCSMCPISLCLYWLPWRSMTESFP